MLLIQYRVIWVWLNVRFFFCSKGGLLLPRIFLIDLQVTPKHHDYEVWRQAIGMFFFQNLSLKSIFITH